MSRFFSIYRRRPGIVDIIASPHSDHTGFRVKWATNFDQATTDVLDAPVSTGYVDSTVPRNLIDPEPYADNRRTRIVFKPETFSIPTDRSWWIQLVPLVGAVEQTADASALTLVIPDRRAAGNYTQFLQGVASTTVQQLDFYTIEDVRLVNEDSANILRVGSEPGGAMVAVLPTTNLYLPRQGGFGSLYIQSENADVNFSAAITLAVPVN